METKKLIKILSEVVPGLAAKEMIEQSTCFIFQDSKVTTYNDMISVSAPLDIKGVVGAVPAQQLYNLLGKVVEKEIDLIGQDDHLLVKGKSFKAKIKMNIDIVLPVLTLNEDISWHILPDKFINAVKFCLFSVSKDMTRTVLTALHIKDNIVESCDNVRLTQWDLNKKLFESSVLLPFSSAVALIKYNPVDAGISDGWIHFRMKDNIVFSCRVYEGVFPNVNFILDIEDKQEIVFPANTSDILDRASVLAESDLTGDKVVQIEIQENEMKVTGVGPMGEIEEKVRVRTQGHYKFESNPLFLQEILSHLRTAEVAKDGSKLKFIGDNFVHVLALSGVE